jgi:hypothetical protein
MLASLKGVMINTRGIMTKISIYLAFSLTHLTILIN